MPLCILDKHDVRPNLEFPTHARSPWTVADKGCLEKVQRRATNMLPSLATIEMKKRAIRQISIWRTRSRMEEGGGLDPAMWFERRLPPRTPPGLIVIQRCTTCRLDCPVPFISWRNTGESGRELEQTRARSILDQMFSRITLSKRKKTSLVSCIKPDTLNVQGTYTYCLVYLTTFNWGRKV